MTPERLNRYNGSIGVDYSGCKKGSFFSTDDGNYPSGCECLVYPVDDKNIDITLITSGTMNRLVLFPIIASRWSGYGPLFLLTPSPILFVLHVKEEEELTLQHALQTSHYVSLCQPRITLLVYLSSFAAFFHSNYPINILRNIGIRHCRTTHFLIVDTDMLVSNGTYPTLLQLKGSLLQDEKVALVMPAFFSYSWKLPNISLEMQLQKSG